MNRPTMRAFAWWVLVLFGAAPIGAEETDKPIVVGIDEAYPPHQFRDAHGQPAGFDVDLFQAVADEVGLEYEMQLDPWPRIRRRLEAGKIDINLLELRPGCRVAHAPASAASDVDSPAAERALYRVG